MEGRNKSLIGTDVSSLQHPESDGYLAESRGDVRRIPRYQTYTGLPEARSPEHKERSRPDRVASDFSSTRKRSPEIPVRVQHPAARVGRGLIERIIEYAGLPGSSRRV